MNIMAFLLQASLLLIGLYGVFYLLLRKSTLFQWNRVVLLSIMLLTVLLPLLSWPSFFTIPAIEIPLGSGLQESAVGKHFASSSPEPRLVQTVSSTPNSIISINWGSVLLIGYLIGVLITALRFGYQLLALIDMIRRSSWKKIGPFYYNYTNQDTAPFSFFHFIVLNPKLYSGAIRQQIIEHEQAHARQYHSVDILLAEVFTLLFWFQSFILGIKTPD